MKITKDDIYIKRQVNITEYFDVKQIQFIMIHNLICLQESQVYKSYKEKYHTNFKENFYKYIQKHKELWNKKIFKLEGTCFSMIFITIDLDKYLSENINKNWKYHDNWHPSWWGLPMLNLSLKKLVEENHQGAIMRYLVYDKKLNEEYLPIGMTEQEALTFKSYVDEFGVELANIPGFISHNIMHWN